MVFNLLAALCAGAFVLLITGLMGIPSLCSLSKAFSVGRAGFFWIRYLTCFLSILSLCCKAF